MRYSRALILYVAALFLQPFLYNLFPSFGGQVNLFLCLTVVLTVVYDETLPGILYGCIFGLIEDAFFGMYVGPGALCLVTAGLAALLLKQFTNKENFINIVMLLLFSTWLYASLYWCVYAVLGSPYSYLYAMKTLPLPLVLNAAAGSVLYLVLIKRVIKHRRDRYFR